MAKKEILEIESKYSDPSINLALDTIARGKQAIFFVNTKPSAEKLAEEISHKIKDVDLKDLEELAKSALAKPTSQCKRLAAIVKRGIAFHHSGLVSKQRELIEENFKAGKIKIICATPTLAIGVDLPAFRSVIRDLKRYGGTWGMSPISVLEYHQMAGRAGRPSYDEWGEAITIAKSDSEVDDIIVNYIEADSENIYSKLAVEPVLRTYILSLISSGLVRKRSQAIDFFSRTFWAHQYKDMHKLSMIIDRMLDSLREWGFVLRSGDKEQDAEELMRGSDKRSGKSHEKSEAKSMFMSANEMVDQDSSYRPTRIGTRVAELYLDPYTAHNLITAMDFSKTKSVILFSILHMVSNTLEMRPVLKVRTKEYDVINSALNKYEENIMFVEPSAYDTEYDEYLGSVKTALFMQEWCDEMDEEYLLEKFNIRPGEIREKLDRADWLIYSSIELAKILELSELYKHMQIARTRLKYGVKEEIVPLLRLDGIGRVRARRMFKAGLKDLGDVRKIDEGSLAQIIGKAIARSVKDQLGEDEVNPISENKRVGQMSINKYDETEKDE